MASTLSDRLSKLVKTMRGQARITESNVQDMLREVRMALLEADVALPVVRDFIARVKEQALGQEVVGSLNPGQALVGIVHKELAATMGGPGRTGQGSGGRSRSGDATAGGDPDGRPAGRRQDHDHRQAGAPPHHQAQEEGAHGIGRRLPAGSHRAVEDGDGAGRRRVVPFRTRPEAARHRAGRAGPCQAPLLRRAAGGHRRPPGHRRSADGRDPRTARGA